MTWCQILSHPTEHGQAVSAVEHTRRSSTIPRASGMDEMERWVNLGLMASTLRRIAQTRG